ncbi:MAG: hypothetical protein IPM57_03215 [Oligoflexia bacterium]|nr:hypothetical protein [Oligoflexia bacterium]
MHKGLIYIFIFTFSFQSLANYPVPARKPFHPSNVCASLLLQLRANMGQIKSQENNLFLANYFRQFRERRLGIKEVKPSGDLISVNSWDNPSNSERKELAARIKGIEVNVLNPTTESMDQRVVTAMFRYDGFDGVRDYFQDSKEALEAVRGIVEKSRDPFYNWVIKKRFLQTIVMTSAGLYLGGLSAFLGADTAALLMVALVIVAEPLSMIRYLKKEDSFYKNSQGQLEDFLKKFNQGQSESGQWAFQSNQYKINREVVTAFLNSKASLNDITQALVSQAHLDTRGTFSEFLKRLAIEKTIWEQIPSDQKAAYRAQAIDNWKPLYVSYDRLLVHDAELGRPVLYVVIRTSLNNDLTFQTIKESKKATAFAPANAAANLSGPTN